MPVSAVSLTAIENGIELSFAATNGVRHTGTFIESKYGAYLIEQNNVVNVYLLDGLGQIACGITQSDELDLRTKLINGDFTGEYKFIAFCMFGGRFFSASGKIKYNGVELIECVPTPDGGYSLKWLGADGLVIGDSLKESVAIRVNSSAAEPWRALHHIGVGGANV